MTSRQITAVAVKVIIVYLIFQTIISFPAWLVLAPQGLSSPVSSFMICGVGIIISGILIVVLWKLSQRLIIVNEQSEVDNVSINMTPLELEKVILRCLGLYLVITYLQQIIGTSIQIGRYYDMTPFYVNLLFDIVTFFFGLFLMARPGRWLDAIRKLRA